MFNKVKYKVFGKLVHREGKKSVKIMTKLAGTVQYLLSQEFDHTFYIFLLCVEKKHQIKIIWGGEGDS
jgi:hypothetical protein